MLLRLLLIELLVATLLLVCYMDKRQYKSFEYADGVGGNLSFNDELKRLDCHGTTLLHTSYQCFYLFINGRRNVLRLIRSRDSAMQAQGGMVLSF